MIGILVQIFITTLMPAFFMYVLYTQKSPTLLERNINLALNGLVLLLLFVVARWDALFYPLRYVWPAVFAIMVIIVIRRPLGKTSKRTNKLVVYAMLASVIALIGANTYLVAKSVDPGGSVAIASPLKNGTYLVGHGGDTRFINYHNTSKTQRYALDIVGYQMFNNPFSNKKDLESYPIYGATVFSPCAGKIKEANNDSPNLIPPQTDKENPSGNNVIISCKGVNIHMSHMQKGSVRVQSGDEVIEGEELGKVGNSGNTSEPHLHIHAVRITPENPKGVPVPLSIDGEFYTRSEIMK